MTPAKYYYYLDLRIEVWKYSMGETSIFVEHQNAPLVSGILYSYIIIDYPNSYSSGGERIGENCRRFKTPEEVHSAYPGLRQFLSFIAPARKEETRG